MSHIMTTLGGYLGYRGREGHWAFLLHRITGLGTGLFLTIHILDMAFIYFARDLFVDVIELYTTPLFGIGEIGLVFCVFYHGVNGLRIAYFDLFAPKNWAIPSERKSFWCTLGIAVAMWLPASAVMLTKIIANLGK